MLRWQLRRSASDNCWPRGFGYGLASIASPSDLRQGNEMASQRWTRCFTHKERKESGMQSLHLIPSQRGASALFPGVRDRVKFFACALLIIREDCLPLRTSRPAYRESNQEWEGAATTAT